MLPDSPFIKIGENISVKKEAETSTRTYGLDWEKGRVIGFVDGQEAMKQAIYKILFTERFVYAIYSWNYGIELQPLYGKSTNIIASELKRVIREALLTDGRITDVTDFEVTLQDKRSVWVTFTAETIFGAVPVTHTFHIEGQEE